MINKLSKAIILLFVMVLVSCDSDDNDTVVITGNVDGTWSIESINYSGSSTTTIDGLSTTATFTGQSSNENAIFVFTPDGDFTSNGSYDITLNTTVAGQSQTQEVSIDDYTSEGTWSQSGNILTLVGELVSISSGTPTIGDGDELSEDYTILELTETTMVLNIVTNETVDSFGASIDVSLDGTLTFSKM